MNDKKLQGFNCPHCGESIPSWNKGRCMWCKKPVQQKLNEISKENPIQVDSEGHDHRGF